jgi:hypothetical protein
MVRQGQGGVGAGALNPGPTSTGYRPESDQAAGG